MAELIPECLTDLNRLSEFASISSNYSSDDKEMYKQLINSCSRFILSFLRTDSLKYRTVSDEIHNGEGSDTILTKYTPILSVSSLYSDSTHDFDDATLVDADDYYIENADAGIVRLKHGEFPSALYSVKISYSTGYSLIPINNYSLVFNEGGDDLTATISAGNYNASALAAELQTQLNATGNDTHTVTYSEVTHKLTFSSDGDALEFKWTSSTQLGYEIGVDTSSDYTGATEYDTDYPLLSIPEDIALACNQLVRWLHTEIVDNNIGKIADDQYSFDFSNIPMYILDNIKHHQRITK